MTSPARRHAVCLGGASVRGVVCTGSPGGVDRASRAGYFARMPLPERLATQIERAAARQLSEMDTQRVIVEPLLTWLGFDIYDLDQVAEQVSVVGAGRATGDGAIDYLVSIDRRPHALIEAKVLRGDPRTILDDRASIQQINAYCAAHAEQPRWGVLTNGRLWAIYDARARCDVFSRRILTVDIAAEPDLLRALSPGWRLHLERFADELNDARLVQNEGIRNRAIRDIERDYKERFSSTPNPASTPTAPPRPAAVANGTVPIAAVAPVEIDRPPDSAVPPQSGPPPAQMNARSAIATYRQKPESGTKPTKLLLPNGARDVRSWKDVLVGTAEYLIGRNTLRVPVIRWTGRTWFSPDGSVTMLKPATLSNGWKIETNWSGAQCVRLSGDLLAACGDDPDCFTVNYNLPPDGRATEPRRRRTRSASG